MICVLIILLFSRIGVLTCIVCNWSCKVIVIIYSCSIHIGAMMSTPPITLIFHKYNCIINVRRRIKQCLTDFLDKTIYNFFKYAKPV